MHRHAFHYKGLMAGVVPVWIDRDDADSPVFVERHWTLFPLLWVTSVLWVVGDGLWLLVTGRVFTAEVDEPVGIWFKITAYVDPPHYEDCWCDEVRDD